MANKGFHQQRCDEALKNLGVTKDKGLSNSKVEELRSKFGWNELTPPKGTTLLEEIIDAIKEPMMVILLVAAVISFIIGEIGDGIGIIGAVALGISIGIIVEGKSKKAADELKKLSENIEVKVIRDGNVTLITSRELVPGDIVVLQAGDKAPADGRLIESDNLKVDESMLTGESEVVKKDAELIVESEKAIPVDMKNMMFSGTLITEGTGLMLVIGTGDNTEIGNISKNLEEDDTETPLQQKLGVLGGQISKISSVIALLLFAFMTWQDWDKVHITTTSFKAFLEGIGPIKDNFVVCVALIVAAVPEGLPTMVNMTLAITMKKMAQINALVRKKEACETIGSVSVICSDKTGTLTQNKMTVVDVFLGDKFIKEQKPDKHFIQNCSLNSTANLEIKDNEISFIGNTTECSLIQYLMKNDIDYKDERKKNHPAKQFEFSSLKKKMFTLVSDGDGYVFYQKGAPERVLESCKFIDVDGKIVELDAKHKNNIEENIKKLQQEAKRVLGFGYKKLPKTIDVNSNIDETEGDFVFQGFVGIMDPLRPDVKDAVITARHAGVQTKMLTGDNINTAVAIANQLGLLDGGKKAVTSSDIDAMDDETLKKEIRNIGVVARSTPETKMRFVQALKSLNEVVAVTGDGINDAPALVKSDIGIAMGITGTEVSQEAADIVLKDDSFATIIKGIKWGRGIYENFQRFIQFQITVNIVAFMTAILSIIFGFKLPFTTIQLLWVNIIMDGPPALSLGLEPVRDRVLKRKPTNRNASIITKGMITSMILNAVLMVTGILLVSKFQLLGGTSAEQETILFSTFAFFSLWNAFNCREFGNESIIRNFTKNKLALQIIGVTAIVQILVVQFASDFFNAVPLDAVMWLKVVGYTFSIVVINEVIKFISRMLPNKKEISA